MSNPGRAAGLVYLALAILAPFRLVYIPSALFVTGDAAATAARIAAHEPLFRLGIVSDLLCGVILVFLVLALYRLFKSVDRRQAVLLVILGGLLPATIYFLNVMNDAAALQFVRGDDSLTTFDKPKRDAMALLFLDLHHRVVLGAEILWGLWLFPFAILLYKSRFLPRFLAFWLVLNGLAYLGISLTGLLSPQNEDLVSRLVTPALMGELAVMLALLIKGAGPQPVAAAAPALRDNRAA
jgi:hypothetical protein